MINLNENRYCVYIHKNTINNKVYIGQTINIDNPNKRWQDGNGYKQNPYFYHAIQKYGWENFEHKILKTDLTKDEADYWEMYFIKQYDSFNQTYGYNLTIGGQGNKTLTEKDEAIIVETYSCCHNIMQTCELTNHNNRTVSRILKNNGIELSNSVDEDRVIYLYKQLNNQKQVNEMTKYSTSTIRKILKKNSIDTKYINHNTKLDINDVNDIVSLYLSGVLINDIVKQFKSKYSFLTNYYIFKILHDNKINTSRLLTNKLDKEAIIKKYKETQSIKETANYFGVSRCSLKQYLIENDIPIKSKNVKMHICCVIGERRIKFDNIMSCAIFLIEHQIVDNKSQRGLRDILSKAMKVHKEYKGILIERIDDDVENNQKSQ